MDLPFNRSKIDSGRERLRRKSHAESESGGRSHRLVSSPYRLLTDPAEKIVPPRDIRLPFYPFGRAAIDNTEYPLALFTPGNHDFDRIGGRAKYGTYLRNISDSVQEVDGVGRGRWCHARSKVVEKTTCQNRYGQKKPITIPFIICPLLFSGQKLKRYPRIILAIRWSEAPVRPTPRPKLISHCGAIFKSIAGKIWCCCCETASNPVSGPTEP